MKLSAATRKAFAEMGRRGAKKRKERLSPERRSEIARAAVQERWRKEREKALA